MREVRDAYMFMQESNARLIRAAVHLTLQMLRSIRLTNQKIEFYKLTNQKMLRSIRSVKWTAALVRSQ